MPKRPKRRSWLGAAFGMFFILGGLAFAYIHTGTLIVGYIATANWVEVPTTIHDLKLERKRSRKSSVYSIRSSYSYAFNDTRYRSSTVSLSIASDNFSSYWHDLYKSLNASQKRNEATAYVDPNNPSKSILDRTFRWSSVIFGFLFLFIFCGVGGIVTLTSLRKKPKSKYNT